MNSSQQEINAINSYDDKVNVEQSYETKDDLLREMFVVYTESPKKIFVRNPDQRDALRKLEKFMASVYDLNLRKASNEEFLYPPLEINPKNASSLDQNLVIYLRGSYKRAKLLKPWDTWTDYLQVILIDDGLSLDVPLTRCFLPLQYFFETEPIVTRCHLADIFQGDLDWSAESEALKFFEELCPRQKNIDLLKRGPEEACENGTVSLPVEVVFKETLYEHPLASGRKIYKYLSPLLIQKGFATYLENESPPNLESGNELQLDLEYSHNLEEEIDIFVGLDPVRNWPDPVFSSSWLSKESLRFSVTHVDECGQIYAHPYKSRHFLREMEHLFETIYTDCGENALKQDWRCGEECVFFHKQTQTWNRARIVDIEKENIQVLLVDYGNLVGSHDNPVTHRDLRIPFHFGDVPIFATRLVLDYLVPVQPGLDYQWPELVLDALYEMIYADKTLGYHVVARKTRLVSRFPVPVQLALKSGNKSNLGETLNVGNELVKRYPGLIKKARLELGPLKFILNNRAFGIGTKRQKSSGHSRSKATEKDVPNPFPIPELPELVPGFLEPVTISAIYPEFFSIHFSNQDMAAMTRLLLSTDDPRALSKEETSVAGEIEKKCLKKFTLAEEEPPANLFPGEMVSFRQDKFWFRGYILSVHTDGRLRKARVHLVDRGDIVDNIDAQQLQKLPESLLQTPSLSFQCFQQNFDQDQFHHLRQIGETGVFYLDFHYQLNDYSVGGVLYVNQQNPETMEHLPRTLQEVTEESKVWEHFEGEEGRAFFSDEENEWI